MPVVLLGGQRFLARAVALAMGAVAPEVRAITPREVDAEPLRRLGVKVAVGSPADPELLDAVLAGAHTACLLGPARGSWAKDLHAEVIEPVIRAVERAGRAGVERLLLVSRDGAAPSATGELRRLASEAERPVASSGLAYAIVRVNLVYGPGAPLWQWIAGLAKAHPARVLGPGTQRWAPVFVDDLAKVLALADDRADLASGTWGLDGPETIVVDDLVDLLAGRHRTFRRTVRKPGRWGFVWEQGLTIQNAALEWLSGDILAGPPSAAEEFQVVLTPLREGIARSVG